MTERDIFEREDSESVGRETGTLEEVSDTAESLERQRFLDLVGNMLTKDVAPRVSRPHHTQIMLTEDPASGLRFLTKSVGNGEKCELYVHHPDDQKHWNLWAFRDGHPEEGLIWDKIPHTDTGYS